MYGICKANSKDKLAQNRHLNMLSLHLYCYNGYLIKNGDSSVFHKPGQVDINQRIDVCIDFELAILTFAAGGKQVGEPIHDFNLFHNLYVFQVSLYRKNDQVMIVNPPRGEPQEELKQNEKELDLNISSFDKFTSKMNQFYAE